MRKRKTKLAYNERICEGHKVTLVKNPFQNMAVDQTLIYIHALGREGWQLGSNSLHQAIERIEYLLKEAQ